LPTRSALANRRRREKKKKERKKVDTGQKATTAEANGH